MELQENNELIIKAREWWSNLSNVLRGCYRSDFNFPLKTNGDIQIPLTNDEILLIYNTVVNTEVKLDYPKNTEVETKSEEIIKVYLIYVGKVDDRGPKIKYKYYMIKSLSENNGDSVSKLGLNPLYFSDKMNKFEIGDVVEHTTNSEYKSFNCLKTKNYFLRKGNWLNFDDTTDWVIISKNAELTNKVKKRNGEQMEKLCEPLRNIYLDLIGDEKTIFLAQLIKELTK